MNKHKMSTTVRGRFCLVALASGASMMFAPAMQAQTATESATLMAAPERPATQKKPASGAPRGKAEDKLAAGVKPAVAPPPPPIPTPVCVGEMAPTANVTLPEGKSGLLDLQQLKLPTPSWLRTIGDPDVVQVEPLTSPTPRTMFFLFGKKVGSTNLMFQNREGRCAMVEVSVGVDTATVQAKLTQLMPNEKNIRISAAADSLVLSGMVADAMAVHQALAIAGAYVRKSGGAGAQAGGDKGADKSGERIVNMLSVSAPQQVMLEVRVAEISKTLLDKLGVNFSGALNRGNWTASLLSNFSSNSSGVLNITKNNSNEFLKIDADKKDGLVKILAEPTIMAISGQEGSFLAGGKIFIPVGQTTNGGVTTITLEEKEFGVGLRFTPTVLDGGRINLKVAPEVSELSREGIGITSSGTGGNAILPLITTRRASTTVQLYDGQSFAIGGLIKSNVTQNIKALPVLGEVPVLGALFRSSDFQTDRSELVFIVTPRLVKPLPADYALPTDRFVEPSRAEFFLGGKMEGTPPAGAPAAGPAAPIPTSQLDRPSGFELN